MKNIKGMSLVALMAVLLFTFNGCGGGGSGIKSNVITENDLFANPQIIATHQHTIFIQLEHPDGEGHDNDIGEIGVDEVPIYYSESVNHTFCWVDDISDAGHSMELIDSSGNTVLNEHINSKCANATLTAGHYTMRFTHGGQSEGTHAIFIRLGEENGSSRGIVNVAFVQDNIKTLITTNSCKYCDLSQANLTKANLKGANLYVANLGGADLSGADLSGAFLSQANLTKANLKGANLHVASLGGADLSGADLTGADLSGAYLEAADLREADLSGADLSGAYLWNADLTGATWVDGTICKEGSVGTCL